MGELRPALIAFATLTACRGAAFECMGDGQCDDGFCEPTGYCSFEDPACPSGRRYGELAGDGLGGVCVDLEDPATSSDPTTSSSSTTSTTDPFTTTTLTTSPSSSTTRDDTSTDPVTTTPITTDPDTESSGAPMDTGPSESTSTGVPAETTGVPAETTDGPPLEITVAFGDRSDADFQDVAADTSLMDNAIGDNMGAHLDLHVDGNNGGSWQVALIRFEISALPDDVTIVAAKLRLWSQDLTDPGEIEVHALTEAWIEGDGDHSPGLCNWIDRFEGTPWTTQGAGEGSFNETTLATFSLDEPWTEYQIELPPELIDIWRADPDTNNGMRIRSTNLAQPLYIPSSEAPDEMLRPLLVISYEQ